MPKEKQENWRKRFDKLTNAIKFEENLKGKNIVTNEDVEIVDSDFLAKRFRRILRHYFKSFIKELLKSEKEMLLERIEKEMEDWRKIADKEETPFLSLLNKDKAGFNDGWRLAINRIYNSWIKLKEEIKKEL